MSKPTLLSSGAIVLQKWMSSIEKRKAQYDISVNYIVDFIADRIPIRKGQAPKIKPKSVGDKVIILQASTGSGKSTVLPPALYEKFGDILFKNIIITEPRILTTIDIPLTILPYNPDLKLGENIGYQTGEMSLKPIKGILFATVGILLQHLKALTDEEFMKKYSFILIDEFHERSIEIDMVLFYIKKLFVKYHDNVDCPMLILMSATFEKEIYMNYFNVPKTNYIQVTGSAFTKDIYYESNPVVDWIHNTIELVRKIHIKGGEDLDKMQRDILIFVSSGGQIKKLMSEVNKLNLDNEFTKNGYIIGVSLNSKEYNKGGLEYQNLFSPINKIYTNVEGKDMPVTRKVIIATNVAETGITISSLKYCIDTGWLISVEFNPIYAIQTIITKNVTQGMSMQRRGRIGRVAPGVAYLLYTKELFNMFIKDKHPDIITNDLTFNMLGAIIKETEAILVDTEKNTSESFNIYTQEKKLEYVKPFNTLSLDFITYPSTNSIQYSLEKLYTLGFITQEKSTLAPYKKIKNGEIVPTIMGLFANTIRKLRIESIRMIFAGYQHKCYILDLITIAVFLEGKSADILIGRSRKDKKPMNPLKLKNSEEVMLYHRIIFADEFIEYLFVWLLFMERLDKEKSKMNKSKNLSTDIAKIKEWCEENGMKYDGLMNITIMRDELIKSFITLGYNPFLNGLGLKRDTYNLLNILRHNFDSGLEEIIKIKKCIYEGYRLNMATFNSFHKKFIMDYKKIPIDIIDSNLILPLPMNDNVKQNRPNNIIIANVNMREMTGGTYAVTGDTISVVNGYYVFDRTAISSYP